MSIDEVCLLDGEYYTVITNKDGHGKKGSLAAIIKGTKHSIVSEALSKVPVHIRYAVEEITYDFANSMDWICRTCFPNARKIGDRFHAQKIVSEGVQEIRIELRRKAIDKENELKIEARKEKRVFKTKVYENGETEKQILARSRYLLFKPKSRWSTADHNRAKILFELFPELKKAYHLSMYFRNIYETAESIDEAKISFKKWFEKISESSLKQMISVGNSIENNLGLVLGYFDSKATNASAESFNAKLKGFRNLVRGVSDKNFFLFRIEKIFA